MKLNGSKNWIKLSRSYSLEPIWYLKKSVSKILIDNPFLIHLPLVPHYSCDMNDIITSLFSLELDREHANIKFHVISNMRPFKIKVVIKTIFFLCEYDKKEGVVRVDCSEWQIIPETWWNVITSWCSKEVIGKQKMENW